MAIRVVFFDMGETLVTSGRRWLPGAEQLLLGLRQDGFRLGIISNTATLSRPEILQILPTNVDLTQFEQSLTLFSSEVGKAKPERAIFEEAVGRSGLSAQECLYFSENIVETLMAQEAGMRAVRVQVRPNSDLSVLRQQIRAFQDLI